MQGYRRRYARIQEKIRKVMKEDIQDYKRKYARLQEKICKVAGEYTQCY